MTKKKVLFHQDNAREHLCAVSIANLYELDYELVPLPLDLGPNEMDRWKEIQLQTMKLLTNGIKDLEKTNFFGHIQKLEKRWTKCF